MKLVINGVIYDGSAQPFIGDLRLLKQQFGFGWGTVIDRMSSLSDDADFTDLLDNDDFVEALLAWMWMVRLRAGERTLTVDEVRMTALDEFTMDGSADEPMESPDPTQASTDSDPVDEKPAAPEPSGRSSKTSRARSTPASR